MKEAMDNWCRRSRATWTTAAGPRQQKQQTFGRPKDPVMPPVDRPVDRPETESWDTTVGRPILPTTLTETKDITVGRPSGRPTSSSGLPLPGEITVLRESVVSESISDLFWIQFKSRLILYFFILNLDYLKRLGLFL